MRLLSIGDACLETFVQDFNNVTECERLLVRINDLVGGSGAIFAMAAKRHFPEVDLICKLAADNAGQLVRDSLMEQGITIVFSETIARTDRIIYFKYSDNKRVMLVDAQSTSCFINLQHFNPVKTYDICHLSGYLLTPKGQLQAVHYQRTHGWLRNTLLLLDIVPHDIYLTHTWDQVLAMMDVADIIIVELRTVVRLLGLTYRENNDLDLAKEVDSIIGNRVPGLILRFGYGNCDTEWIRYGHQQEVRKTGYKQADSTRGYGDGLTVDFLMRYF